MKFYVIIAALLLHQVMGDTLTLIDAANSFANKLYQKLSEKEGNVLVCPISLHIALTLVQQGASDNTDRELKNVLNFNNPNLNIRQNYNNILKGIKNSTLKIANRLFPAADYELNKNYKKIAENSFYSGVEGINYNNPTEAAAKINTFVADNTNNKITNLISADSLSDLTKLVIINAVHFQAPWKNLFSSAYEDDFKVTPQKKVKTMMMTQTDYFGYKEDLNLDAKILKMDYDVPTPGYSMLFILPNKDDGLPLVERKLQSTNLGALLSDLKQAHVEVTIPKFKLEQTHNNLKEILMDLGVNDLFSSRAQLQGIANGNNLYVSSIVQKTFINVHENGTEAAAATVFLETLSANFDQVEFFARRPFHFYLVHNSMPGLVLFEGRFVQPQEQSFETYTGTVVDKSFLDEGTNGALPFEGNNNQGNHNNEDMVRKDSYQNSEGLSQHSQHVQTHTGDNRQQGPPQPPPPIVINQHQPYQHYQGSPSHIQGYSMHPVPYGGY